MNLLTAIDISATGITAQRTRINIASMNLANADVTKTIDGGPYRAKSVVFEAVPLSTIESDSSEGISFKDQLDAQSQKLSVVKVAKIVDDPGPPFKEVYDPSNPEADSRGMVKLPNVNVIEQMVDIMEAARAYEANITAMNTAKSMALKSLDIAR